MFAAIFLPHFRLQSALRWREKAPAQPVAIVDENGVVRELNECAGTAGVARGMPGPQALARCPGLALLPPAPAQERTVQAALLEVAGSLSPDFEDTAGGWTTLDLRTVKVRDWNAWGADIVRRCAALELQACVGVAPNPDLASLAARRAENVLVVRTPAAFLSQLAVSEIEPPPHLLAVLRDWGIHTLGQLTSLPRGDLADRLGPDADRLWQRAAGQTQRLLRLVRPVAEFTETFAFEQEIETTEPLLFLLRRFVDALALRLGGVHRVAAEMRLALPLENGAEHARRFIIPSPTAAPDVLFRILQTHLEALHLEHRPTGVRLRIEPVQPDHRQLRLFESPLRDANQFGETVARLAALVGSERVGVAENEDTHQPDGVRLSAPRFHEIPAGESDGDEDRAIGLPLRRYRPALPAQVQVVRQAPAYVVSEMAHGRVAAVLGPYRAGGGWWDRAAWGAEEWDVELADGGLFRLSREQEHWFVEGCY